MNPTPESRDSTRDQYERFPYPPVPVFALPRADQGKSLSFEEGGRLVEIAENKDLSKAARSNSQTVRSHAGIRILVAGCGTFESLVVAQRHPLAREIVAVDLSAASIARLQTRMRLARVARPFSRMEPVRAVAADLFEWEPSGSFDYILASNVLHHVEDPAALLKRLSSWLSPGGLMRVVTYPRASRIWMRETGRFLRSCGIDSGTPHLRARVREAIRTLPSRGFGLSTGHPVRSCFESQPETGTDAGLVDAFLNACENPLSPLEWREACDRAGLVMVGEAQTETSRSDFLVELEPATSVLDAWTRLQIMDDLLELCANPVLWFRKSSVTLPVRKTVTAMPELACAIKNHPAIKNDVPERVRDELTQNLARVSELLRPCGVSLEDILKRLRVEVGPRVSTPQLGFFGGPRDSEILPGLSILDYL